jgi:menaquinone-specific isochorismate synthase
MDAVGNGEAAVTIRSALIRENAASVFAGAGIVRDSDVDEETRETRVKARAVIEALE